MSAYFITGSGTDIGKTWLCCALLRHWHAAGLHPAAFKPVLSGYDPEQPGASDAGQLLNALQRPLTIAEINTISPWRFRAPLSPDMAAMLEGRAIDFGQLVAYTRRVANADFSRLLVEGVGGVMAPLTHCHTVRDWISAAGLPCVLVAGSYLGSLSHTLTALTALAAAGIEVKAIAVNETAESTVAMEATVDCLKHHAGKIPIVALQRTRPAAGIAELAAYL